MVHVYTYTYTCIRTRIRRVLLTMTIPLVVDIPLRHKQSHSSVMSTTINFMLSYYYHFPTVLVWNAAPTPTTDRRRDSLTTALPTTCGRTADDATTLLICGCVRTYSSTTGTMAIDSSTNGAHHTRVPMAVSESCTYSSGGSH
jgi:hypothetical protein